jgi:hypothetical protein
MFLPGDLVEVKNYKASRENPWANSYKVRVTHSQYLAGDPSREFVGVVLFGWDSAEGSTLAIQNKDARPYSWGK